MRDAALLMPVAESIADGSSIDWSRIEAAAHADDQAVIGQLRVLADLATLHRTMPADPRQLPNMFTARRSADAPAIGSWAHLDLIERIGGGTYGDVYRAWDRHLECEVALKLLRSGDATRIVDEARRLARVRHTNVVTVHGVAEHDGRIGLWMELVDGATLERVLESNGPFGAREAALIGIDICRALAAIHAAGLIHRDVKAQNVMRAHGGRIVLMDLGTGREIAGDGTDTVSDLAGTPLYLAPELFAGGAASQRTDLYSLGVLLYRLVTAAFPVRAATIEGLKAAHARGSRTRLRDARADLPTAFVRVVDRAIASDPSERDATAGALEADLAQALDESAAPFAPPPTAGPTPPWYARWRLVAPLAAVLVVAAIASPGSPLRLFRRTPALDPRTIRSIAVVPLTNLSGDPGQEYFVDGMTETLIDNLAKVRTLRVISRTSAMRFKGTKKSLRDIATALNVDAVLEGSVIKAGDRVRISADLVHVATEQHVWVDSFDRDLRDVLALQAEVARTIARAIQIQLSPLEQAGFVPGQSVSVAAQDAYLQGRFFWNKRTAEGYQKALDYFRQAAAIDPSFALAYAGQADVYNLLPGRLSPFTAYPLAKDAANRALELDPTLAEAHASLGFATFIFDRDWPAAEAAFKRALQYKPGYATAHHWYGKYLAAMGRLDIAIIELKEATELDPLSAPIREALGDMYYYAHRHDEAIAEYRAALDIDSNNPSIYLYLALTYLTAGRLDEAGALIEQATMRVGQTATLRLTAGALAALRHDRATALKVANDMAARGPEINTLANLFAYIYICLGDHDRAFEWLDRGEQARAPGLLWAKTEPVFDPVRHDRRFQDFLQRLRLAP